MRSILAAQYTNVEEGSARMPRQAPISNIFPMEIMNGDVRGLSEAIDNGMDLGAMVDCGDSI